MSTLLFVGLSVSLNDKLLLMCDGLGTVGSLYLKVELSYSNCTFLLLVQNVSYSST